MGRPRTENPRRELSPSKRGYTQVYFTPEAIKELDEWAAQIGAATRQDAVRQAIKAARKTDAKN